MLPYQLQSALPQFSHLLPNKRQYKVVKPNYDAVRKEIEALMESNEE